MARPDCCRTSPAVKHGRRTFLNRFQRFFFRLGVLTLCVPLIRFFSFHIARRPRHVTVPKKIKTGGFHLADEFILFAGTTNAPWAVSRICTHLGCRVTFRQNQNALVCPCHHSRFSVQGKRLAGPARRDLQRYPVKVIGTRDDVKGYVVTL